MTAPRERAVRVFIVDDSASSRLLLRRLVASDPRLEVCGEAGDGRQALERVAASGADIVLMDIVMHVLDGLAATQELMRRTPKPVLVVSDLVGRDAHLNFRALEAGALDLVGKPTADELGSEAERERLCRKIRVLAEVPVVRRWSPPAARADARRPTSGPASAVEAVGTGTGGYGLLCVGASTGGPPALRELLKGVGPRPPWPILVVQHMSPGFIGGMARWLGEVTGLKVEVGSDGRQPCPGEVFLAPDHAHLELRADGALGLSFADPVGGHRPAVDALFDSVARSGFAPRTIAALLTGMGSDGAAGLKRLREAGGWSIAQDAATSVVYGMPCVAWETGAACEELPLSLIGPRARALTRGAGEG